MMHHQTKKKYIGMKDSGLTAEELKGQLLADGVSENEATALITEIYTPTEGNPLPHVDAEVPSENSAPNVNPNTDPEAKPGKTAKKFDYRELTGQNFLDYEKHVHGLPLFDMQDFLVYKVNAVIKEQYPGLPNSPKLFDGIEIVNDRPIHQTRIDVKTALEMNAQVRNSGRYYLLK